MAAKPEIALVGPGRLGSALALALAGSGYRIREIVSRDTSTAATRKLSRATRAKLIDFRSAKLDADLVWFCVPDREIASVANKIAVVTSWKRKVAFHSSGALASDELDALRRRGAVVASVHPLMTFVRGSVPSLKGVPFAIEGDATAISISRRIVRDLGGNSFHLNKDNKAAYHAWGGFASPLLVALLATAEQVGGMAGFSSEDARKRMLPIVRQTILNYAKLGPAGAFSGPLVRGDVAVVREHLRVLRKSPVARDVYIALAQAALQAIPVQNKKELEKLIGQGPASVATPGKISSRRPAHGTIIRRS
jgi:predicted short-subunit dehydrogenase-like oxidoreductase (DUF2520 family)